MRFSSLLGDHFLPHNGSPEQHDGEGHRRWAMMRAVVMRPGLLLAACMGFLIAPVAFTADNSRNWQSGTLLEAEKQQVPQGATKTSNTEGTAKDKGNKTQYSQTTTSTTTENYDTFQVFTIQGDTKTYVARERLLFPWSKPANITVGEKVKYAVSKNTLYLLDDDGKQHKAGISRVSMNADH
jgi:hypothetical protein